MTTPRIPPRMFKKVAHKPAKAVNPRKVPFEAPLPMELKTQLTGKGGNTKRTPCIGNLIDMLDCLKRTGFNDGPCQSQIAAYKQCNETYKANEELQKRKGEEDLSNFKSARDMRQEQLNELLRKFHSKS